MRLFEARLTEYEFLNLNRINPSMIIIDNSTSFYKNNFLYYYEVTLYVSISIYALQLRNHFYNI